MDALIALRRATGLPAVAEPLAPAEDYGFFGPTLLDVPARNTVTYTPAEGRAKWDRTTPFEQYAAIVAKREVGDGPTPYAHNHHDALVQFDKSAS
ncbi:hypothetical protein [Mycolicibacterium nivoides]|uniref:Uncharacterized protein n=1 Tax=Mycolicibacterium nivoides TaxID=2487344 RepID=A0ABW9LAD8_9MYCO